MVDLILGNRPGDAPKGRHAWDALRATRFKQPDSSIGKSAYYDQAFCPAPKFDAQLIYKLFQSRFQVAEDELLQMQTDPAYFRNELERQLLVKRSGPKLTKQEQDLVLCERPFECVSKFIIWQSLRDEAWELVKVQETYGTQIRAGQPLPNEYMETLTRIEAVFKLQFHSWTQALPRCLIDLPAFSHHFSRAGEHTWHQLTKPERNIKDDRLFYCICELTKYDRIGSKNASNQFAVIDDILSRAAAKDKGRVDQALYDDLSDMAAVDEALSSLKYHRSRAPLARAIEESNRIGKYRLSVQAIRQVDSSLNINNMEHGRLWNTISELRGFSKLPSKQMDQESLVRNQAQHDVLTRYWHEVRLHMERALKSQGYLPSSMVSKVMKSFEAPFSEDYRVLRDAEQAEIRAVIEAQELRREINKAGSRSELHLPQHLAGLTIPKDEDTAPAASVKVKVKSRPAIDMDAADPAGDQVFAAEGAAEPEPITPISVGSKSVRLFTQMFTTLGMAKGLTKWDELVAALVDAGCSAEHKGGSAVAFEDQRNRTGCIVLHRPHPHPTLDPITLKSVGKRLKKWFGWDAGMFVERGKEEQ
ncbi:hypothetical protein LTR37_011227 [Vermiconidia calcicola]|uniref:Uncharacterized protein n=1 Tax=Vermiconidia calcicola TaxID=1690605 RepID=A0ACC3N334_9PEZI|nr:hypothetical protein LTR37_011227 [Vermiconidia calcicola]